MTRLRLIIILLIAIFSLEIIAKNKKNDLHNPKYAKLILSKDKNKILPIVLDTSNKESDRYTVLYANKKCDGEFINFEKISGRTKSKHNVLNNVTFTIKLDPLYSKDAEGKTKVCISHWCNQKRIWKHSEDRLKRKGKQKKINYIDGTPQKNYYVTVHHEVRKKNIRWDYNIRQAIKMSDNEKSAPKVNFNKMPNLVLELVPARKSKLKMGIVVYLKYLRSKSNKNSGYINNYISCLKAGKEIEAKIIIKKNDGSQYRCIEEPLSKLKYVHFARIPEKKRKKAERAEFFVRIPEKGGSIEVSLDMGPIFGVLKTSKTFEANIKK